MRAKRGEAKLRGRDVRQVLGLGEAQCAVPGPGPEPCRICAGVGPRGPGVLGLGEAQCAVPGPGPEPCQICAGVVPRCPGVVPGLSRLSRSVSKPCWSCPGVVPVVPWLSRLSRGRPGESYVNPM